MEIVYKPNARKGLRKIPLKDAEKIMDALENIAKDKTKDLDIKPLTGRDGYRLRIGKWRAIYELESDTLSVVDIGPRGQIYK